MDLRELLRSNGFLMVNKALIKKIGLNETIILSYLIEHQIYHDQKGDTDDGWFYSEQKHIEEETTLSPFKQNNAFKNLIKIGFIKMDRRGIPPRNYFIILTGNISNFFTFKSEISLPIYNKNKGIKNKKIPYKQFLYKNLKITQEDLDGLLKKFPKKDVKGECENADDWLAARGKTYKNYSAFMRIWLKKEWVKNKVDTGFREWIPPVNKEGLNKLQELKKGSKLYDRMV